MSIPEKDIKMLWGLAAGRCSFPGCRTDCLVFIDEANPTVLGDMAHVIAQSTKGPRGGKLPGVDRYDNLLLLCPTHHRQIDTGPAVHYPAGKLLSWKADHEKWVRDRLTAPPFQSRSELGLAILTRLQENHAVWKTYGPESDIARANPVSNTVVLWHLRKLSVIIPNNAWIVSAIRSQATFFTAPEYALAAQFIEHAAGFEASAFERREAVPRFPVAFEEMIRDAAAQ